jgi:outer membrane lipoprotein-sorting protein
MNHSMSGTSNSILLGLAATAVTVSFCLTARAANPCQPVFDALDKVTMTPRHTYSTITAVFTHGQPRVSETIVANGKVYIRVNGKWRPGLTSPQEMQEQQKENRLHAKGACQLVGGEMVGGEAAVVYSTHTESKDAKEDGQIWISKTTGRPLRDEEDIELGAAAGKEHRSTRFEYGSIQPPM